MQSKCREKPSFVQSKSPLNESAIYALNKQYGADLNQVRLGLSTISKCISADLRGMEGGFSCAVVDLVAATGAGGGDEDFGVEFFQVGEENQFADLHRDIVVFLFVAKRARHAATTGGDFLHGVVLRQ